MAPGGCTYTDLPDGFEATASTRSLKRALFCSLWLMASIWMGVTVVSGRQDVPFGVVAGGVVMFVVAAPLLPMSLAGQVRLTKRGNVLDIFIGAGGIGLRRRLDWKQVRKVEEFHMYGRSGSRQISIDGETKFRFGQWLTHERRGFLLEVLQRELAKSRAGARR